MEYRQQRQPGKPPVRKRRVFTPTGEPPASPHYTGHSAGLHGEDTPHVTTADVRSHLPSTRPPQDPDDYEAGSHITAMTRRYNGVQMPDGVMVRQGNDQFYLHNSPAPRPVIERAGRKQAQLPPSRQTDELPVMKRRFQPHWLFWVGIAFLVMILGYVGFNAFGAWWQVRGDDGTYGRPRTFQMDAVVGHGGDSQAHPTHFMAVNLNRHVVIIEIPAGDISKSVIYGGPTLLGDGQDLTPVTLTFSDVNGDGKVDMVLHILDQSLVYLNNGTKFVPPSGLASGGSNPPTLED